MIKITLVLVSTLVALTWSLPLEKAHVDLGAQYGNFFEGDMIVSKEQMDMLSSSDRNGMIVERYRWPNKTLIYQLSPDHTKEQNEQIEKALNTLQSVSCVKFAKRTNEAKFVNLTAENSGCWSYVGFQNNQQDLNLQKNGCVYQHIIMHEFLHALGFYHMQSAYDRDEFVTIHLENVTPGTEGNFNKYSNTVVTHFNTTYDYLSVMHYAAYAFSKNGKPTIIPVDEKYLNIIGKGEKLSEKDILKLNRMYEC